MQKAETANLRQIGSERIIANLQKLHRQIMDSLAILLGVVLVSLVPSVHQRISQAFRCGHIRLLQLKLVRREGWGVVGVVLDISGDRVRVGGERVSLGKHIYQITNHQHMRKLSFKKTETTCCICQLCQRIWQLHIQLQRALQTCPPSNTQQQRAAHVLQTTLRMT